jgi:thiosulfate sulfurtransferase
MSAYRNISAQQARQLIQDAPVLILDCRALKDYRVGHIENALHVHEQLRDSLIRRGDKQQALLIYCYHGHASQHLAEMFGDFGFQQVYSLTGGYSDWSRDDAIQPKPEEEL